MEYKSALLQHPLFEGFADASDNVYIYVCDMSLGISRWSKNAIEYFDLGDSEYIEDAGTVWGEKVHPGDRELYFEDIDAVFSGRRTHHACQYRAINRFGKYVWLECKGRMVYDDDGNAVMFAGMMTRLDNQSKYDPLTGVPTRSGLYDYDFDSGSGAVILFGIDHFRNIISIYGYDYCDDILANLVKSILGMLSHNDRLIRFQGDEFAVILPDSDMDEGISIFNAIKQLLGQLRMDDGRVISLSVSGGGECYPIEGNKDDIINHLELAMDYAKQKQRSEIVFYSGEIELIQIRRSKLKRDLRNAIADNFNGFELYFQPWVDAKSSYIVGCEALLRFKGEEIKDAGPMEFIPLLEEDNSITEVGYWVMRESMRQQKIWSEAYADFKVSFNVSYRQFFEERFAETVIEAAKEYGVNPENMVLELTESSEVDRPETLANIFDTIRSNKFHIALDDFGTGYASLEVLKKIHVDEIKIEHSFVRELKKNESHEDMAIIESIMYLCKKLNCHIVVEGVENEEVDSIIRNMDADYLQGYYYSRPVCKDDFNKMLDENRKK